MQHSKEEYGWVLIDTPEKRQEMGTIRVGDQTWIHPGVWTACVFAGASPDPGRIYRRPVDVGEGWELVPVGDVIKEGDEIILEPGKWSKCTISVGDAVCDCFHPRRRKKPEAKAETWCALGHEAESSWCDSEETALAKAKEIANRTRLPAFVLRAVLKFESKTEILETEL